jgi:dipicolinate synthase subunit A
MSAADVAWANLKIAVLAGDEREREIARLAAATGARVSAYGFPWPDDGIPGVHRASNAREALDGARVALFPIPGIAHDGSLFAPACEERIIPDSALLSVMAPDAHIVLGWPDERLERAAGELGIGLHEYETDRELMLLRGPAICEGALALAIQHTDVTIHQSPVAVVGQGTIGSLMTRMLLALGAHVHVFARNPAQRATAYAAGAEPHPLEQLVAMAPRLSMIFSSVPAPVVDDAVLAALPPGSLVLDLAAPPGGVDLDASRRRGHRTVWARGMGRRAPVTVGASQWIGIRRRIEAALGGAPSAS